MIINNSNGIVSLIIRSLSQLVYTLIIASATHKAIFA